MAALCAHELAGGDAAFDVLGTIFNAARVRVSLGEQRQTSGIAAAAQQSPHGRDRPRAGYVFGAHVTRSLQTRLVTSGKGRDAPLSEGPRAFNASGMGMGGRASSFWPTSQR